MLKLAVVLITLLSCQSRSPSPQGKAENSAAPPSSPQSAEEIIFAGLSGTPPRFIDSGPNRGAGWLEYHTHEIRKGMKADGFNLRQEWMTPARIAHEFKAKSPICIYPTEWRNPTQTFGTKPDRIYTIPLDLGGEQNRSIIIRKGDLAKFKKHLDVKGDLNIDSLLSDSKLKTLLIRDKDYGRLTRKLLDTDREGNQIVRKEFAKNISILVIRDNRQLVEMLNASRFDYTFSDSIEGTDLAAAGIDEAAFLHLNYSTSKVSRVDDPNLVLVSVACADHPLTRRAIPYFNKWIKDTRGVIWTQAKISYRDKLDRLYARNYHSFVNTTVRRFLGAFNEGVFDRWYPLQQTFFPGLEIFPKDVPFRLEKQLPVNRPPSRWAIASISSDEGALVNQAAVALLADSDPDDPLPYDYYDIVRTYPIKNLSRYLSEPSLKKIRDPLLFSRSTYPSLKAIPAQELKKLKKFTLFAFGLSIEDLESLSPILSSHRLEDLAVFGAGTKETAHLFSLLPPTLKSLNLTACSNSTSDLHNKVKQWNLKSLHLSNSQITKDQLPTLIRNLPATIEHLSLGFLRTAWDLRSAEEFSRKRFSKLKTLDLENAFLSDEHLGMISRNLPPTLEILRIGLNGFTPTGIKTLFANRLPKLVELDLTRAIIARQPKIEDASSELASFQLALPESVRILGLERAGLSDQTLSKIKFPSNLTSLNLNYNWVSDEGLKQLLPKLSKNIERLELANTAITTEGVAQLAKQELTEINYLNLSYLKLTDEAVQALSGARFKINRLNLKNNIISNIGTEIIAKKWLPSLVSLNLSENPISEKGTEALAENIGPSLRIFHLAQVLGLNASALAKHLPKNLSILNLSMNSLTDQELEAIAENLPPSLDEIYIGRSVFSSSGILSLAKHLPRGLGILSIDRSPVEGQVFVQLWNQLPPSVFAVTVGNLELTENEARELAASPPPFLRQIVFNHVDLTDEGYRSLMRSLPKSVVRIEMNFRSLTREIARALSSNWPNNLRELIFAGTRLGDQGITPMAETLPLSTETFWLHGNEITKKGLSKILEQELPNLHDLNVSGNAFSKMDFGQLKGRAFSFRQFNVDGSHISREELLSLKREQLEATRWLFLGNNNLANQDLIDFLKVLPKNLELLSLHSTALSLSGAPGVIDHLPRELRRLIVTGTQIGEKGLALFRSYKQKRETEDGMPFELVD